MHIKSHKPHSYTLNITEYKYENKKYYKLHIIYNREN